jgi:hypothetical protein
MKRWLAREALLGSAAVLASLGMGCKPDQSVKGGAPVLMEMIIMSGGSAMHVLPDTKECPAPVAVPDAGVDGGSGGGGMLDGSACDPDADKPCRLTSAKNWCSCVADEMDMTVGAWNCAPFGPTASVVAIFDRLIDVSAFDPMTGEATGAASLEPPSGSPPATAMAIYGSNGSPTGLIFPLFGNYPGPNLTIFGNPALPSSTAVTVKLDKTVIRAKDGKTPFTGDGFLEDGTVTFTTGPFTAEIAPPPDQMDGDGGTSPPAPDMTPAILSFTNVVDHDDIMAHLTVTSGGTPVPFALDPAMGTGTSFNVVPTTAWPANAMISITLDATTPDVLDETLGAPGATATFMTGAP